MTVKDRELAMLDAAMLSSDEGSDEDSCIGTVPYAITTTSGAYRGLHCTDKAHARERFAREYPGEKIAEIEKVK